MFSDPKYSFSVCQKYFFAVSKKVSILHHSEPTYMVQKYQNEISPIFYYGKKLKTSEKLLKIPDIQPPD